MTGNIDPDPHGTVITFQLPSHGWEVVRLPEDASLDDLIEKTRSTIAEGHTPRIEVPRGRTQTLQHIAAALVDAGLEWVEVRPAKFEYGP